MTMEQERGHGASTLGRNAGPGAPSRHSPIFVTIGMGARMAEKDFYEPIRQCLETLFRSVGKAVYSEIGASRGFSERVKRAIPSERNIVFAFLRHRPDLLILIAEPYRPNFVTVEIKEEIRKLEDIYQAKLYKEVLMRNTAFSSLFLRFAKN